MYTIVIKTGDTIVMEILTERALRAKLRDELDGYKCLTQDQCLTDGWYKCYSIFKGRPCANISPLPRVSQGSEAFGPGTVEEAAVGV